jgi:hypothetical protein
LTGDVTSYIISLVTDLVTTDRQEEKQMAPNTINFLAAQAHRRQLRDAADRQALANGLRGRAGAGATVRTLGEVRIRYACEADARSLRLLAQLDSREAPAGAALIAELDGRPVAALPLDGSPPIADPFRPSAELLELLRIRAGQLQSNRRRQSASAGRLGLAARALALPGGRRP